MRIVSSFLKRMLYPSLSAAGIFRRTPAAGLAVVTYHGVRPQGYEPVDPSFDGNLVSAETLGRQLRLLKAHYSVITPEDALSWLEGGRELPPKAVLLTCDDGLLNNLTDMLPVLQQESLKCLFFVTGASTGEERTMLWYEDLFLIFFRASNGPFEISCEGLMISGELGSREQRRAVWWSSVKRLSQIDARSRTSFLQTARVQFGLGSERYLDVEDPAMCRRFGLLTCAELRELASAGMTIGAHTMSHPMLSQLPVASARAEITECRARLESAVQKRVWAFAYPFGDAQSVTPLVLAIPKEVGYEAAFLNYGGGLGVELPPFALPRIHVTAEMRLAEFEAHVSGFHARLQRTAAGGPEALRTVHSAHWYY